MGTKRGAKRGPYKKSREFENTGRLLTEEQSKAAKKRHPLNPEWVVGEKEYGQYRKARVDRFWGRDLTDRKKERIERFQHAMDLAKREAEDRCWKIGTNYYNRYEVMRLVLSMVSTGLTVAEVAKEEGFPPVWLIREWERLHYGFKNEMKLAEQAMAEIRYQDSIDIVMEAENDDNAKLVQLKSEAQSKLAAMTDGKWNTKQQIQVEDTTKPVDLEDAKKRLESWARANPELAKKMMPELYAQLQEKVQQNTIGYVEAEVEASSE